MSVSVNSKRVLFILGGLIALSVAVVSFVLYKTPDWMRQYATEYGKSIGYEIQLGHIDLSVTKLKLEIQDIRIAPLGLTQTMSETVSQTEPKSPTSTPSKAASNPLLDIKQLSVDFALDGIYNSRWHIRNIALSEAKLMLLRTGANPANADKKSVNLWNWQKFIQANLDLAKTKPQSDKKSSPFNLQIDQISIIQSEFKIDDQQSGFHDQASHISINLKDIVKLDTPSPALEGQMNVSLGELEIPLFRKDDGTEKVIKLGKVSFVGGVQGDPAGELKLKFDVQLGHGSIAGKGDWQGKTGVALIEGNLKNINLQPLIVLVPTNQALTAKSGVASGDWKVLISKGQWSVKSNLQIDQLAVFEPDVKGELVGWEQAKIREINLVGHDQKTSLSVQEILLNQPTGRFIFYEDRSTNFGHLLASPKKTNPSKASATKEAIPSGRSNFDFNVNSVTLNGGHIYFTDYSIKPFFQSTVNDLHGTLLGLSNQRKQYSAIALDGRVDQAGELVVRGSMNFSDPLRNNDVSINFRRIPLLSINPYSKTFAGYEILGGTISLNLVYKVTDANLKGSNQIVINRIRLGNEVQNFKGPSLPLKLAISVLEDSDGVIDLNIPVSGNLDNPEFSTSGLVWQAIKTVVSNIVTAPFRALGNLLGIEHFEGVYFDAGESGLLLSEKDKLQKIAQILQKRPKSQINIIGVYDPDADAIKIAEALIDRRIFQAAGFKIASDEMLPSLSLEDDRIQNGLRAVYIQDLGLLRWTQALILAPSGSQKWEKLHANLLANIQVNEALLTQLGNSRAQTAKKVMTDFDKTLNERINLLKSEKVAVGEQGLALRIAFKN